MISRSSRCQVLLFQQQSCRRRVVALLSPVVAHRRCATSIAAAVFPPSIKHGGGIFLRHRRLVSSIYTAAQAQLNTTRTPRLVLRHMATLSMDDQHSSSSSSSSSSSATTTSTTTSAVPELNPMPDFTNAQAAYATKTTRQLVRAYVVFTLCRIPILVRHAESVLQTCRRVLGDRFTDFILKQTMFGHFCAGENETSIVPTIQALERAGIGSILDFAAESSSSNSDNEHSTAAAAAAAAAFAAAVPAPSAQPPPPHVAVVGVVHSARVYDYESEAQCDAHVTTFQRCIHDVKNLGPDGFAAIKVTALGNPKVGRQACCVLDVR
jgi:hypothetical protein